MTIAPSSRRAFGLKVLTRPHAWPTNVKLGACGRPVCLLILLHLFGCLLETTAAADAHATHPDVHAWRTLGLRVKAATLSVRLTATTLLRVAWVSLAMAWRALETDRPGDAAELSA